MPGHRYLHYDVFTRRPLAGNQLAVFPDAAGLAPALMQRIALEMAFPETTFILPPETSGTDVRMRIFTPQRELPMAGHPTIGSTFALARDGVIGSDRDRVVFGLGIGPTSVSLEWGGEELTFAWMHQPLPAFGPVVEERGEVSAALGIDPGDIHAALPIQVVSSGLPVLFVPLETRRAVDAVTFELSGIRPVLARHRLDDLPVFTFSLEAGHDDATAYSRMFAPAFGIPRTRRPAGQADRSAPTSCTTAPSRPIVPTGWSACRGSRWGVRAGCTSRSRLRPPTGTSRRCRSEAQRCWWRRVRCICRADRRYTLSPQVLALGGPGGDRDGLSVPHGLPDHPSLTAGSCARSRSP